MQSPGPQPATKITVRDEYPEGICVRRTLPRHETISPLRRRRRRHSVVVLLPVGRQSLRKTRFLEQFFRRSSVRSRAGPPQVGRVRPAQTLLRIRRRIQFHASRPFARLLRYRKPLHDLTPLPPLAPSCVRLATPLQCLPPLIWSPGRDLALLRGASRASHALLRHVRTRIRQGPSRK